MHQPIYLNIVLAGTMTLNQLFKLLEQKLTKFCLKF